MSNQLTTPEQARLLADAAANQLHGYFTDAHAQLTATRDDRHHGHELCLRLLEAMHLWQANMGTTQAATLMYMAERHIKAELRDIEQHNIARREV